MTQPQFYKNRPTQTKITINQSKQKNEESKQGSGQENMHEETKERTNKGER